MADKIRLAEAAAAIGGTYKSLSQWIYRYADKGVTPSGPGEFSRADVAAFAITKQLVDFGMPAPVAFDTAREQLRRWPQLQGDEPLRVEDIPSVVLVVTMRNVGARSVGDILGNANFEDAVRELNAPVASDTTEYFFWYLNENNSPFDSSYTNSWLTLMGVGRKAQLLVPIGLVVWDAFTVLEGMGHQILASTKEIEALRAEQRRVQDIKNQVKDMRKRALEIRDKGELQKLIEEIHRLEDELEGKTTGEVK